MGLSYEDNKRIILNLAKRHSQNSFLEFQELVAEGNLVFVEALRSYDESHGVKFSTWLYKGVTQRFLNLRNANYLRKGRQAEDPEFSVMSTGENSTRTANFRASLMDLGRDAAEVVKIVFDTPAELIESIKEEVIGKKKRNSSSWGNYTVTLRALKGYLIRSGWTNSRINKATKEIKGILD
jgi:DNA-directed RNA polymerase specialized sigma subunit